jgi:hypothetical protein
MSEVQDVIQNTAQAALDAAAEQQAAISRAVMGVAPVIDINKFINAAIVADAEVQAQVNRRVGQPVFLAEGYAQEQFVITSTQFEAKRLTLSQIPAQPEQTSVFIIGGTEQLYNVDYQISGRDIVWAGLALEYLLDIGSVVIVRYFT